MGCLRGDEFGCQHASGHGSIQAQEKGRRQREEASSPSSPSGSVGGSICWKTSLRRSVSRSWFQRNVEGAPRSRPSSKVAREPVPDDIASFQPVEEFSFRTGMVQFQLEEGQAGSCGWPFRQNADHFRPMLENSADSMALSELASLLCKAKVPNEILGVLGQGRESGSGHSPPPVRFENEGRVRNCCPHPPSADGIGRGRHRHFSGWHRCFRPHLKKFNDERVTAHGMGNHHRTGGRTTWEMSTLSSKERAENRATH